jgi:hypothetical protein
MSTAEITKKYPPVMRRALAIQLVEELGATAGQFRKLAAEKKLPSSTAGGTRRWFQRDSIVKIFTQSQ